MSNAEEILKTIRHRRTIKPKEFLKKEISEKAIQDILESANWAPNHGRTEPWRLTVFTGSGIDKYIEIRLTLFRVCFTCVCVALNSLAFV